jgi:uncharacterized protein (TIGR02246 family)
MRRATTIRFLAVVLCSLSLVASQRAASRAKDQQDGLTYNDDRAIRATIERYRTAWLENNARSVLKTFSNDAVLQPAHGASAVVGIAAIEKYWFSPGGLPTTITQLNITVDQVSGNGNMAFARGLDSVAWTVEQDGAVHRHAHPGTYINVMRKQPNGSWLIQVHMWDDGPEHVE